MNKKKWIWSGIIFTTLWLIYPFLRACFFYFSDPIPEDRQILQNKEMLDDASGLNRTRHGGIFLVKNGQAPKFNVLKRLIQDADKNGTKLISIGSRHSMGKQSLSDQGIHIDLSGLNKMEMEKGLLRVGAGAIWKDVLKFLSLYGLSVEIMQSNSDFSIGGTLSVNAHGWQPNRPPVSSSVQKISIITTTGEILTCSRENNSELFRHAIGGYGMFGIILEAWIKPVPNEILHSVHEFVPTKEFSKKWEKSKKNGANLSFGRLSVVPNTFFEEILLTSYFRTGKISRDVPSYSATLKNSIARAVFMASLNSKRGKSFRQMIENLMGGEAGGVHSRSSLMIEPVRIFTNNDEDKIDLLIEVFVPQDKIYDFTQKAAAILKYRSDNLLNVTVREIAKDPDTALTYAKTDVFGLVMLFTVNRNSNEEATLKKQAIALYDIAIKIGGSFYLPYRNFANQTQLLDAYPELPEFIETKKKWDPNEIFNSGFYQYLKKTTDL